MVNDINGLTPSSTSGAQKRQAEVQDAASTDNQQQTTDASRSGGDSFEISNEAKLLNAVQAQVADLPDVDQARVDALSQQINSGQYQVDSSALAQDIVNFEG